MANKKILIVEDEDSIRNALKDRFAQEAEIIFIQASNGVDALLMAEKEKPDMILLDVLMPKMHGIDMLKTMKSKDWGKSIPVVLLTNYENDPKVVEAVGSGLCQMLVKGKVSLDVVVEKVRETLGLPAK